MSVPKQPSKNTDTNGHILFFMSCNSKSITFIGHRKNKFLEIDTIFILKQILNIYAYYL